VWSVAVGEVDGVPVVVSGGADGTVRVWSVTKPIRQTCIELASAVRDTAIFDNHVIAAGRGLAALIVDRSAVIV
jgi:hypothetical protein